MQLTYLDVQNSSELILSFDINVNEQVLNSE